MKRGFSIILGPPCGGKGTQSKKLKNFIHISAGDVLRKRLPADKAYLLNSGQLVDLDAVNKMMEEEFMEHEGLVLFDGYPRSVRQAKFVKEKLGKCMMSVIILYLPEEELYKRCEKRHFCKLCQTTFTSEQECCATLSGRRLDDNPEVLKKRLEVFYSDIFQIAEILGGPCFFINGNRDTDIIHKEIKEAIEK